MNTKIDIFSGFLGAGKTMLIKKLISEGLYSGNIVIIENEFGQVAIDGSILKKSNIKVKEINAGCICCSISGDFKEAILSILKEFSPSRIIIEPSGVAKLSEVLKVLKEPVIKDKVTVNMVVTLVDVLKFDSYISNFSEFYTNQIKCAKTIVLSRTQKADEKAILRINEAISKLNSRVNIVTTPWDRLKGEKIVEAAELDAKEFINKKVSLIKKPIGSVAIKGYAAEHHFESWGYETPKTFNVAKLKEILKGLGEERIYGKVIRAKGIVQTIDKNWVQFDYVPGEYEIRETIADYTSRLCVIGSGLSMDNLKKLFST